MMKTITQYITEQKQKKSWIECVQQMYAWYCDNFGKFYDKTHHYKDEDNRYCELIEKDVVADCSGFVAACLCLAGYTKDSLGFNVRLGSFNHYKNPNVDTMSNVDKEFTSKLSYMADIHDFKCVKLKNTDDLSEIKTGDILVKGSHVTIAADDGAKHLYDWGSKIETVDDDIIKQHKPISFYTPKDKTMTYPFRSYWTLKK